MNLDAIPIAALFAITIVIVMLSIEVGYRLGNIAHARSEDEKEPPASNVAGAVLGLASFMLAFAFGIVWDRFGDRNALVREEANAIQTAYMRSDFLPAPQRSEAKQLLRRYLDARVAVAQPGVVNSPAMPRLVADAVRVQRRLWDIAAVNAWKDMNSDIAGLYIESLNEVDAVHASRVAVGYQARVPIGIWLALYGLTITAMMSIGYHTGIVASRRSMSTLILATSFALVIVVIATLDRPGGFIKVSQQPLINLQRSISAGL